MALGTSATPPPTPAAPTPMTANNAIFLILFGMFLISTLLPVLLATIYRLIILLVAVLSMAAVTNPSDHSFAVWISQQNEPGDLIPDASVGVSKWFMAMYQTAKDLVCNKPLTWRFHNVLVFSVVHVPSKERDALGVFGTWRWADEAGDFVKQLCRAPWIIKISRGGTVSSIEKYMVNSSGNIGGLNAGDDKGSLRHRKAGTKSGPQTVFGEVESESHRQIRAKAMQYKVKKDWKNAAVLFLKAAKVTDALLTRANYEIEAAWCTLEDMEAFPKEQSDLFRKIRSICDELVCAGYFDEAARGLSDLAVRLKRKFSADCKSSEIAEKVAELYVQAKNIAETGGSLHSAAENGLWAAGMYADAGLWSLAEECFKAVGDIRHSNGQNDLANQAYGNATLCRIGQLDMVGAEIMLNQFTEYMGGTHHSSGMDVFLSSLLKAYNKWSLPILETATERYDSIYKLAPWQRQCLASLQEKLSCADLR